MILNILVIDDDPIFTSHIEMFSEYLGWQVNTLNTRNLEEIKSQSFDSYNYIILDGKIPYIQEIISLLEDHNMKNKVIFVSGNNNTIELGKEYGFQHIYKKPFDIIKINDYLRGLDTRNHFKKDSNTNRLSLNLSENDILRSIFDELNPAITIHKKNNSIDLVFSNKSSKREPFSIPFLDRQNVNLRLLKADLDHRQNQDSTVKMASREDWSNDIDAWIYSRLYDSSDYYWLTRQVMREEDLTAPLNAHDNLSDFMIKMERHLKKWGITRARLYKVMKLYSDDKPDDVKKSYVLKPLYEFGGGFVEGQDWYKHQLICKKEEDISKHIFEALSEETLNNSFYTLHTVNNENYLCPIIEWGDAGTRALIPIKKKLDNTNKTTVLGLLAIDQRIDHLPAEAVSPFSLIGDQISGLAPLTKEEMGQMQGYFIQQLIPKLFDLLNDKIEKRLKEWNVIISKTIKENIEKSNLINIDKIIEKIKNIHWNDVANIHKKSQQSSSNSDLVNWYFLRAEEYGQLHVVSGIGDLAEDRKKTRYFNNLSPFKEGLGSDIGSGYIIQDFQKWVKEKGSYSTSLYTTTPKRIKLLSKVGSWIGVHFKAHDMDYLMVVHAKDKDYFNDYRVRLLKQISQRLAPLILWENAENSRELFNRAIVHELATPIQIIEQEYKNLTKEHRKNIEDIYASAKVLHYMVENIKILNRNRSWNSKSIINSIEKLEKPNLDGIIKKLHFLYIWAISQDIKIEIDPIPGSLDYNQIIESITLKKEIVGSLIEILFNLIHNAVKYTDSDFNTVFIKIKLSKNKHKIHVYISNITNQAMTDLEREKIFLPYFRAKNTSQNSGGGLGLAVVKILCSEHNMKCRALKPKVLKSKGNNKYYNQTFLLDIPVLGAN